MRNSLHPIPKLIALAALLELAPLLACAQQEPSLAYQKQNPETAAQGTRQSDKRSLSELLFALESAYQVSFNYDDDAVRDISLNENFSWDKREKLEKVLNQLYDKITLPVQKAKDVINKARAQIVAALAKLDPANPLHQSAIAKLQEMMARLDGVETRMGGVYDLLATKVDLLIAAVDKLIDRLDTGNPLLLIPMMELQEVRDVIADFRDKLANT